LKTESAEPPDGAGAGEGNVSGPVASKLVGLYVPVKSCPESGSDDAAASSSVSVTLVAHSNPPQSDMMIAFAPVGPTRSTSMSSGDRCVRPLSVTASDVNVVPTPLTLIVDGYGDAFVGALGRSTIETAPALNWTAGVIVRLQPPVMLPEPPAVSSTT